MAQHKWTFNYREFYSRGGTGYSERERVYHNDHDGVAYLDLLQWRDELYCLMSVIRDGVCIYSMNMVQHPTQEQLDKWAKADADLEELRKNVYLAREVLGI